jgi:MFS family permease
VYAACALAWVTIVRASLVQYSILVDSMWGLVRISLAYAVFMLVAGYAIDLLGARLRFVSAVTLVAVHATIVASIRPRGAEAAAVASAISAIAGSMAGAFIALAVTDEAHTPRPG